MPGQQTDHPSSIYAGSAHRPPQLHPLQVGTQTTPDPSMPGQCRDTPDPSLSGQHSDHPSSIQARSVQRPPQVHPFQVGTQTTPPPDFVTWGLGKGTENSEELDFGGHWDSIIELPQD